MAKLTILLALVLAFVTFTSAHENLKEHQRMVKKRLAFRGLLSNPIFKNPPPNNNNNNPQAPTGGNSNSAGGSSSDTSTATNSQPTSSNPPLIVVGGGGGSSSGTNSGSLSSTTPPTSTTGSSSTTTTQTDSPTITPPSQTPAYVSVTLTDDSSPSQAPQNDTSKPTGTAIARKTITILAVIAASVGGIFLIWTGIRKWKFRPSQRFEERMAPIDWQPGQDENDHAGIIDRQISHRRNGSQGSHGSFGSSGHDPQAGSQTHSHGNSLDGPPQQYYQNNMAPDFPPPHGFTSGTAAPAHYDAYADLHRGPSPQPPMMTELRRGPSASRGPNPYDAYDAYDGMAPPVPVHQTAYGYGQHQGY